MKILLGVQCTGNGHITRAAEIHKLLARNPLVTSVDILVSGMNASIQLPFTPTYNFKGISFEFGKDGKISPLKSFQNIDLVDFFRSVKKIPFRNYDLVISDFEPISAWGAIFSGIPSCSIGNMYSLTFDAFPIIARNKMKLYNSLFCPSKHKVGFFFSKFDESVFNPVIRPEIYHAKPKSKKFYVVYLNSFSEEQLVSFFSQQLFAGETFIIYSAAAKHVKFFGSNVIVKPISKHSFTTDIIHCRGVISTGGFQTSAEAIHLGKKLFLIPIKKQPEQKLNVIFLHQMGASFAKELDVTAIYDWLKNGKSFQKKFTDDMPKMIEYMLTRRRVA